MFNAVSLSGIFIPFFGTALGSAFVFFLKGSMSERLTKILTGFAAGVMVAAAIWSLIIPALEASEGMGSLACVPVLIGFWLGVLFLLGLDELMPHLHRGEDKPEGPRTHLQRTTLMVLAVTLHNIPEGIAVGVVYAGLQTGNQMVTLSGAIALALGIAIQNIPEGAIISMPLHSNGLSKGNSFLYGVGSGIVEPIGTAITILLAGIIVPFLPYFLSFAAGAMMYVVVEELIPEMSQGGHSNLATLFFAAGFSIMMVLDVVLG